VCECLCACAVTMTQGRAWGETSGGVTHSQTYDGAEREFNSGHMMKDLSHFC
jgi:hypothetical protein